MQVNKKKDLSNFAFVEVKRFEQITYSIISRSKELLAIAGINQKNSKQNKQPTIVA